VQTVSVRLLMRHAEYCRYLSRALALKCVGKDAEAKALAGELFDLFGQYELSMERYYDHTIMVQAYNSIFNSVTEYAQ